MTQAHSCMLSSTSMHLYLLPPQAPGSLSSNPSPSTQAFGSRCWSMALYSSNTCWKKTAASTCVESATTLGPMSASPCTSTSKVSLRKRETAAVSFYLYGRLCSVCVVFFYMPWLLIQLKIVNAKAQRSSELNQSKFLDVRVQATSKIPSWRSFCVLSASMNPTKATHGATAATTTAASLGESTAFIR